MIVFVKFFEFDVRFLEIKDLFVLFMLFVIIFIYDEYRSEMNLKEIVILKLIGKKLVKWWKYGEWEYYFFEMEIVKILKKLRKVKKKILEK